MKKTFEFVRNGFNDVLQGTWQGEFIREVKEGFPNEKWPRVYRKDEVSILQPITEEFLPAWTMVYTSHGKKGCIIRPQQRDENGILHPAMVQIGDSMNFSQVPIWQDQLLKAIK